MQYIQSNLRFLRKQQKLTQQQLAEELGIKRALIGAYEEGRAKPNYDILYSLSRLFKVSIDRLITSDLRLTERVSIFSDEDLEKTVSGTSTRVLAITVDKEDNENIELVPVKAAAGYLAGYSDPQYLQELRRFRLPFLPTGSYRAFEIKGDSMLPLQPGSIVVGEYVDDWRRIKDGETYVFLTRDDGIVYKRAFNKLIENGCVLLRSDNPSYPAFNVKGEEILEVWRAVLHISHLNKGSDLSYRQILDMMQELKSEVSQLKGGVS